jgi:nucleotide-binding universal stress UspA family protein
MFKNILVGVDGSDYAYKAAGLAGEMCCCTQANALWVVSCFEPVPSYLGEPNLQLAITEHIAHAESVLAIAIEKIGEVPAQIHKEIIEGSPADTILSVASVREVDLIIMGTRGLGRISGLLLGSQSQKVVNQAHCPVLLVR